MADISAEARVPARGCALDWSLHFDDVADTITVRADYTLVVNGQPAPTPLEASLTFRLNTQQAITLDLLTGRLSTGALFDGTAGNMLNTGDRVRTGVRLSITPDRAQAISYSATLTPA